MLLQYDRVAKLLLEELHAVVEGFDELAIPRVLMRLCHVSPAEAAFPKILRDQSVWPENRRYDYFKNWASYGNDLMPLGQFIAAVEDQAVLENAPAVTQWHFARLLATSESTFRTLVKAGIDRDALLHKMALACGLSESSEEDKQKTWYVCDTHLFLHYKSFADPNWRQLLGAPSVFVVPAAIIRELDDSKFHRSGQTRTRARTMLAEIRKYAFAAPTGKAAAVNESTELLLVGREPAMFPEGLDPSVADDRLIATAYEFRWRYRGLKVMLLSGDTTVQLKAREYDLGFKEIPVEMELDSEASSN